MTKYILAGGNDRLHDDYGSRIARQVSEVIKGPSILSCFFSSPEDQWQAKAVDWEAWFKHYFGDDISYAASTFQSFLTQVDAADVIYLHGGNNELLLDRMKQYRNLERAFQEKIVIASSAGANYLAKNFWTRSKQQVKSGAGILPVSVMVHYGSIDGGFGSGSVDWAQADAQMESATKPGEEILRIHEGEYFVIEQ